MVQLVLLALLGIGTDCQIIIASWLRLMRMLAAILLVLLE